MPVTALSVLFPTTWLATKRGRDACRSQQFPRPARKVIFFCSFQGPVREQMELICSGQAIDGSKDYRKWDPRRIILLGIHIPEQAIFLIPTVLELCTP